VLELDDAEDGAVDVDVRAVLELVRRNQSIERLAADLPGQQAEHSRASRLSDAQLAPLSS
jgi:hypothetical protein